MSKTTTKTAKFGLAELYEISDAFDHLLVELDMTDSRGLKCVAQAEAAQAKVKAAIAAISAASK